MGEKVQRYSVSRQRTILSNMHQRWVSFVYNRHACHAPAPITKTFTQLHVHPAPRTQTMLTSHAKPAWTTLLVVSKPADACVILYKTGQAESAMWRILPSAGNIQIEKFILMGEHWSTLSSNSKSTDGSVLNICLATDTGTVRTHMCSGRLCSTRVHVEDWSGLGQGRRAGDPLGRLYFENQIRD